MKVRHALFALSCVSLWGATVSCGGDDDERQNGDGDGGGDGDGDIPIGDGDGDTGGTSCESTEDCESGRVCHPIGGVCVTPGAECSSHGSCPARNYCDPTLSVCLPGVAGSPCAEDENCSTGSTCTGNVCACSGFIQEQENVAGPLDIYFIFDRTASMGQDCDYEPGQTAPVNSKACLATYAMSDYLINVEPATDTRLAFQFMSYDDGCDGGPYSEPLVDLTNLPVSADHEIIQEISDENFAGGSGTQIEGALRGIFSFTVENETPGREMIGVLMTDGDPNGCEHDIDLLAGMIADHLESTGIRTFIIGMEGATESNLERLALAGGAAPHDDFCGDVTPPCHYWNVGDGSGEAIADALNAIAEQAVPFACDYPLATIQPGGGQELDLATLNIQLTQNGQSTIIVNVPSEDSCPTDQPAWYFDDETPPTSFSLCEQACDLVKSASQGATMSIVSGCTETVILR
jgi:hypothetical protein